MLQEGTRLNDTYIIKGRIGAGGGGIVYKAWHERLNTDVVIKQMKSRVKGLLDGRAEADILKELKHTRLPRVYDFLELDGEIYTVMDFIPGMSLEEALKDGRFVQEGVYRWALQLADALSYLHSQTPPIIHSDIKPANIMLLPDGDVCLIDFNISLAFDQGMRTSIGTSGGYSPPEQYRDFQTYQSRLTEPDTRPDTHPDSVVSGITGRGVDERSDIYSLGATLYHLLTGERPSQDFDQIQPITDYPVKISEGFALIISRMMELEPEKRYQNGGELLYALEHIYELDSEYQAFWRAKRRKKIALALLFAAGACLTGSGILLMRQENQAAYNQAVEYADVLIGEERYDEARQEIQEAMDRLPGEIYAYEKEVYRLYSMREYEEAISYGRNVLNDPAVAVENGSEELSAANIYYLMGNSYFETEDYLNAAPCFEAAILKNDQNGLYYRDYAITLAKTGNPDSAEKALDTAVLLGLGQDSIYMAQGEIAHARGEDEKAIGFLKDAIRSAEDEEIESRATILCAQIYQELGEAYLDAEIALLETAENKFGPQTSMHMKELLADAYAKKAQTAEAFEEEYYAKALGKFTELYKQGYSTRQMMENIAILYEEMGSFNEAGQMLAQIIEQYPEDYRAYKRRAFLEADIQQQKENRDRDYTQVRADYETALALYEEAGGSGDTEMQMLENLIQDLRDGGWF